MAYFYTYIDPAEIEAKFNQNKELEPDEKEENENKAMEMETHNRLKDQGDETKMSKIWFNYDLTLRVPSKDKIIITGVNFWYF